MAFLYSLHFFQHSYFEMFFYHELTCINNSFLFTVGYQSTVWI